MLSDSVNTADTVTGSNQGQDSIELKKQKTGFKNLVIKKVSIVTKKPKKAEFIPLRNRDEFTECKSSYKPETGVFSKLESKMQDSDLREFIRENGINWCRI